jgi:hypothetical protein
VERPLAIILRLILIGICAISCSRWHNDANRLQLVCGSDVDPSQFIYIQVAESPASGFDAVLISDGQWTPLHRSAYGCLEVPRTVKRPAEIAIRDQASTQGRVLHLENEAEAALVSTELSTEPKLRDRQVRALCPANPSITQKRLPLSRVEQPTRLLTRTVIRAEIYDAQGELLHMEKLDDDAAALNFDSNWPEGSYQLKLISQDIFERNAPAFESSCQVIVDRTAPSVTSSLSAAGYYDEPQNIRRLAPGAQVSFDVKDANAADLFICLKERPALCADEDFLPLRSITAPTAGLWDIQAYAVDKAGQRSTLLQEAFAVYHQEQIDQLLARLSNVQLNLLLGLQAPAMAAMQDAKDIRKELQLDGERTSIQWAYVENFWKLDQQVNLIKSIDFGQPIRQVTPGSASGQFLLQGDKGPFIQYENDQPVAEFDRFLRADFSGQERFWTFSSGGTLNLHENRKVLRSWKTDLASASLTAGQTGDKVVIWTDKGQETLIRVYDHKVSTDEPAFKAKLPKTPFIQGKFSFFGSDRYLIGRNNRQLLIWDSERSFSLRAFEAPEGCIAKDYAVRFDQKIYLVSHRARFPGQPGGPVNETFCDLQLIDLENTALTATLSPRLANVINPATVTLSADRQQSYLALTSTVSSFLHFLDLGNDEPGLNLKLNEFENIYRVAPLSVDRPIFFVSSSQRLRLLQFTYDSNPIEYFSGTRLGNCTPQTRQQRFLCYDQDQSILNIHTSERDRTLQPAIFRSYTRYRSADDDPQYRVAGLLNRPLHAFFNRETKEIMLLDEDREVRASARLESDVKALSLHDSGRLALGMQDGNLAVIEEGKGLSLLSDGQATGPIVDVRMTADTVYALRKLEAGGFILETLRYESGRLSLLNKLALPSGPSYSHIVFSEKTGRGVVYQKDRDAVTQEAVLFTQDGKDHGRVPMSMCSLVESRSRSGFHFLRDQSVYFHDFTSGLDQLIKEGLSYSPCAFLEGEQLYAIADFSSKLIEVASDQVLANGINFAVGPEGVLLVATSNNSFKVLSPDGKTNLVTMNFQISTNVDSMISSPDHPDIVLVLTEYGLGQGIRRLTTSLDSIDRRLSLWGI